MAKREALRSSSYPFASLLLLSGLFITSPVYASSAPPVSTLNSGTPQLVNFPVPISGLSLKEIPPAIIIGGWRNYFVGGYSSYSCAEPWGLFDTGAHSSYGCFEVLGPIVDNPEHKFPFNNAIANKFPAYDRNYDGIFSMGFYQHPGIGTALYSINHTENKGEQMPYAGGGVGPFQNSVSPTITNLTQTNMTGATCYNENYGCYFAFVTMSWVPYNAQSYWGTAPLNDSGPIVWPSLGYVSADGTKKLANGPRLPHAITYNGYVYVFYQDDFYTVGSDNNNLLDVGDRRSGLKVMRAWLPNIESGNWLVYYEPPGAQGGFTQPALPAGFSNYGQGFFSTPGPLATPLFGRNVHNPVIGSSETKSFAVAQAGPNLFVGAEWYTDYQDEGTSQCPGKEKLALRTSSDLINWSNRLNIYGCLDPSSFQMDYAELVDAGSTSNTQIDPSNFYIVGSYHNSDGSFSYYSLHEGL